MECSEGGKVCQSFAGWGYMYHIESRESSSFDCSVAERPLLGKLKSPSCLWLEVQKVPVRDWTFVTTVLPEPRSVRLATKPHSCTTVCSYVRCESWCTNYFTLQLSYLYRFCTFRWLNLQRILTSVLRILRKRKMIFRWQSSSSLRKKNSRHVLPCEYCLPCY